ncbi:glycosyltransferase [Azoarcus olearius]|uniref:glycosyltransferase family 4 protein n=1 Tax=Azoarcus sp. (strain BH72) TaxID=418699 RepID=UPI0008061500|nr:glycosyltransferase family 4 protein [Azoarcus olearius]ANQ86421.1 glycosyltransferase [Azoarcus olearius]
MKVAIISYPMLFQNSGGLQVQVSETAAALQRQGIEARLIDPVRERLANFDIVHVFSAINGNHRAVEQARALGLPVVVSPLIRPHWTARLGWVARRLDALVGRLTQWNVKTEYRHIASCLQGADAVIALGDMEKTSIVDAFGIPSERVRVVPNGIPGRFFNADPAQFCIDFGVAPGYVLSVATVSPHKNQLALVKALEGTGQQVVLIGPLPGGDSGYLDLLLAYPHVRYVGPLDYESPLLASAYAAASVFCLPALSEVMPLSVMEALAAGTPVVMTREHCMDLSLMRGVVCEVSPQDEAGIRRAVLAFFDKPPPEAHCRDSVAHYSWDAVADAIARCYREVVGSHELGARASRESQ